MEPEFICLKCLFFSSYHLHWNGDSFPSDPCKLSSCVFQFSACTKIICSTCKNADSFTLTPESVTQRLSAGLRKSPCWPSIINDLKGMVCGPSLRNCAFKGLCRNQHFSHFLVAFPHFLSFFFHYKEVNAWITHDLKRKVPGKTTPGLGQKRFLWCLCSFFHWSVNCSLFSTLGVFVWFVLFFQTERLHEYSF